VALVRTNYLEKRNASIVRVTIVFLRSVHRLLFTVNVVPSSPILVTLIMEVLCSSDASILTRATRRKIPENGIFLGRNCLQGVGVTDGRSDTVI
jgi:hypothetical protein